MRLLTLKSVVVAVDLDEASQPVLRTAAGLASLAGASLHLVHVAASASADAEQRLRENFRRAAPDAAEPASLSVLAGSPVEVIAQQAAQRAADVVILGPHRGGVRDGLGSTAASVVRTAPCPCLVVATELHLPLRRVLVPIDVSDNENAALSVALTWASALRPRGAETDLAALHVALDDTKEAEAPLRELVQRTRADAGGAAHVDLRELIVSAANPADAILRAAVESPADLLVMGTRSCDGRADDDLGSVSAEVARATPCPLLLVPPTA